MLRIIKNVIMLIILGLLLFAEFLTIKEIRNLNKERENYSKIANNKLLDNNPSSSEPIEPEKPSPDNLNEPILKETNSKEIILKGLIIIENIAISLIVVYLFLSHFQKLNLKVTFISKDKIIIYSLGSLLLILTLTNFALYCINKNYILARISFNTTNKNSKRTVSKDVSEGIVVNSQLINLEDYNSNITIKEPGIYTLKGNLKHSLIIDTKEDVTLNLNGITIRNNLTGAIINKGGSSLTIILNENTTNILSDGGSSIYDACIYSNGDLTIKGSGELFVFGNQEEGEGIATKNQDLKIIDGKIHIEANDDGLNAGGNGGTIIINGGEISIKAKGDGIDSNKNLQINGGTIYTYTTSKRDDSGIDTDTGYTINDGLVIALGNDMLEAPLLKSKQYSLTFNLNAEMPKGTLITLMNKNDNVIISFEALTDFKTLILSSPNLNKGTYYLYQNGINVGTSYNGIYINNDYIKGEKISIADTDTFIVTSKVTKYGLK